MDHQTVNHGLTKAAVAILGGTFDPVHNGHLQLGSYIAESLKLDQIRLMPSYQPMHRETPSATTDQRLAMLELAVANLDQMLIDDRELRRKGPSYTLLSLQELRAELSDDAPLYFILGEDAFYDFDSWYHWQEIIKYAHILVAGRPGNHAELSDQLAYFVEKNKFTGESYPETPAGTIVWVDNTKIEIASSDIRQRIKENKTVKHLLPDDVYQYILHQNIYL